MKVAFVAMALLAAVPATAARVPFVGCPLDGQLGPQRPPLAGSVPDVPDAAAGRLAFYAAADLPGVLAPRGWKCAATAGSNGSTLVVAPVDPGNAEVPGDAVVLARHSGGTSGRFEVAEIAARLFPDARAYVAKVEREGQKFDRRPYPADRVTRRGPWEALVTTPAGKAGLAVQWPLVPAPRPVDALFRLDPGGDHDLVALAARLPAPIRPLVAIIIADVAKRR